MYTSDMLILYIRLEISLSPLKSLFESIKYFFYVLFAAPNMYDCKNLPDLNSYDLQLVMIHLQSVPCGQLQPILVPCDLGLRNTTGFASQGDRGANLRGDQV